MNEPHPYRIAASAALPTRRGRYQVYAFTRDGEDLEHVALVKGDVAGRHDVPTRIHSECLLGDTLGSLRCDCHDQLQRAHDELAESEVGVIVYLRQRRRGASVANKVRAYSLQDRGLDRDDANLALGLVDRRAYDDAAGIVRALGVESVSLMTNNPRKLAQLAALGVDVSRSAAFNRAADRNAPRHNAPRIARARLRPQGLRRRSV